MKKNLHSYAGNNKVGAQYQNFAHLLYRQGAKDQSNNPDSAMAVSSYKSPNQLHNANTRTVPVTSFPNGRVTTMLQNSYSNTAGQKVNGNAYSRAHIAGHNMKNYKVYDQKGTDVNNSFTRSKSVYKDQDWVRNGSSGSRSTASHSSGLPPAFKKNSSISADYGNNYQQKIMNSSSRRAMSNVRDVQNKVMDGKIQPSMKSSGRDGERTWTLKGSNINNEFPISKRADSIDEVAYSHTNNIQNRPPSQRLSSLGRADSSSRSSLNKLPFKSPESFVLNSDFTVIHVIDENKNKQKDFKCSLAILLKHMKYFEKHLKSSESTDDIDISVHCDVLIFEWLLNYIENGEKEEKKSDIKFYDVVVKDGDGYKISTTDKRRKPVFEIGNAISILISSDYLKMSKLVDECLDYFIDNISDILRLPIDMS
jgi:hypothetical protein